MDCNLKAHREAEKYSRATSRNKTVFMYPFARREKIISILKSAGIVEDEKRGAQVFYTLKMPCVLKFFSCVETVLESRVKEQIKCVR